MALIKLNNNSISAVSALPSSITTGKVGQVVNGVLTTTFSSSSTSFVDTGLTLAITPSSTNSKILIQVHLNDTSKSDSSIVGFRILRDSTVVTKNTTSGMGATNEVFNSFGGSGQNRDSSSGNLTFLDSPSSTSELTYKVQLINNSGTGYLNRWGVNNDSSGVSTITAMEILL